MKTLLLILLGVFIFADVANTAPVPNEFQAAEIQDLLSALVSKDSNTAKKSSSNDVSQSDNGEGDYYDRDDDDTSKTTDKLSHGQGSTSRALVSRIQAELQDLMNALSMSETDKSSSRLRYDNVEQDAAEDEEDGDDSEDRSTGAGDQAEYSDDEPGEVNDSPDYDKYGDTEYWEDADEIVNSENEMDVDDGERDTVEVARAYVNTLPEKVKAQILTAIVARAVPHQVLVKALATTSV